MSAADLVRCPRTAELAAGCAQIAEYLRDEALARQGAAGDRFTRYATAEPGPMRTVGNRLWLERAAWEAIAADLDRLAEDYRRAAAGCGR
ncbi:MAG: hypothetical protein ACREK5_06390 [Gemmatimonadota bacterium]